eukprot:scaffold2855_cov127-Cylindrotheca_fusiformis.AAC.1
MDVGKWRLCKQLQVALVLTHFCFHHVCGFSMDWKPLKPSSFEHVVSDDGHQIAKDEPYLKAVLDLWKSELGHLPVETSPFVYYSEGDKDGGQTPLYGHLVRRMRDATENDSLPGVLFFHTGAGPHDVFLFYKAAILLQKLDCVVLVCDILSDQSGWAWGPDRTRYNHVRDSLMKDGASLLQSRVTAAAKALCNFNETGTQVDPQKLAAMGWCLGGQSIMELSRAQPLLSSVIPGLHIRAMVTFHGVFRRDNYGGVCEAGKAKSSGNELSRDVLVYNGCDDPFVSKEDLDEVTKLFSGHGFSVSVLEMEGAKHGFTNPAQSLNENPAFEYNQPGGAMSSCIIGCRRLLQCGSHLISSGHYQSDSKTNAAQPLLAVACHLLTFIYLWHSDPPKKKARPEKKISDPKKKELSAIP